MIINVITVGQLDVNCYIVSGEDNPNAMVVDPGDEFERIDDLLSSLGAVPRYIVLTHAHYDHACAAGELKSKYSSLLAMHALEESVYRTTSDMCVAWGYDYEDFPAPDLLLKDGDHITFSGLDFRVLHTPGHSPGSICLYDGKTLFSGDTLFAGSAGRTDLSGGNSAMLVDSLRRIMSLPDDTVVFCGHGPKTTVKNERETNPFSLKIRGDGT